MSGLDNLISKIKSDAEANAAAIIKNAEATATELLSKKTAEAEAAKKEFLEKAAVEAEGYKSKIVSNAMLKMRDEKLRAKQEAVAKIMAQAAEVLKNMPETEFFKFLESRILESGLNGDEVIFVSEKYKNADLSAVNEKLKAAGKLGGLTVQTFEKSGFVAKSKNVEINNTFEALLDYNRDDCERLIAEALW